MSCLVSCVEARSCCLKQACLLVLRHLTCVVVLSAAPLTACWLQPARVTCLVPLHCLLSDTDPCMPHMCLSVCFTAHAPPFVVTAYALPCPPAHTYPHRSRATACTASSRVTCERKLFTIFTVHCPVHLSPQIKGDSVYSKLKWEAGVFRPRTYYPVRSQHMHRPLLLLYVHVTVVRGCSLLTTLAMHCPGCYAADQGRQRVQQAQV
jgi:hypothetical protein